MYEHFQLFISLKKKWLKKVTQIPMNLETLSISLFKSGKKTARRFKLIFFQRLQVNHKKKPAKFSNRSTHSQTDHARSMALNFIDPNRHGVFKIAKPLTPPWFIKRVMSTRKYNVILIGNRTGPFHKKTMRIKQDFIFEGDFFV